MRSDQPTYQVPLVPASLIQTNSKSEEGAQIIAISPRGIRNPTFAGEFISHFTSNQQR